ncbi:MAG: hypothetical protein GY913_33185 [Proteobacteria bacterium]|nr:hypothetical protein [Pseudomonadota bacterium]MCP4921780.1 hypothetical protein [Pseudomonadota bacterium]
MMFGLFGMLFPECAPSLPADTGDSGTEQTVWLVNMSLGCEVGTWFYELEAWGDAGGGTIEIFHMDGSYSEAHPLQFPEWSDDRQSWLYNIELDRVGQQSDVVLGESTNFNCLDFEELNWHIALEDSQGDEQDCAVFGVSPETLGLDHCSLWTSEE